MKTEDIEKAFSDFEHMQERHELAIKSGLNAFQDKQSEFIDFTLMDDERSGVFIKLKRAFDNLSASPEDIDGLQDLDRRLSAVIAREDIIKKLMEEYRANLKESFGRMKHGRAAINGYGKMIQ